MDHLFFVLLVICYSITPSFAANNSTDPLEFKPNQTNAEKRLLSYLDGRMPRHFCPSDVSNFSVYFDLHQIVDVDEKRGILTAKFIHFLLYVTEALRWNSSDFDDIRLLNVEPGTFWEPDVYVFQTVKTLNSHRKKDVVDEVGRMITHHVERAAELTCEFDVSLFPFDYQSCFIEIELPIGSKTMFDHDLIPLTKTAALLYYTQNDQWEIIDPVNLGSQLFGLPDHQGNFVYAQSVFHAQINIKRRPLFYIVVFICPNMMIYLLSSLVFFLSLGSGDKTSYIVTIFLAEIVNAGALTGIFPASSLGFPLLAYFIFAVTVYLSLLCAATVLVVNIYQFADDREPTKFVKYVNSSKIVSYLGLNNRLSRQTEQPSSCRVSVVDCKDTNADNETVDLELCERVEEVAKLSTKSLNLEVLEGRRATWILFSEILDYIFFIVHCVVMVVTITVCVIVFVVKSGSRNDNLKKTY